MKIRYFVHIATTEQSLLSTIILYIVYSMCNAVLITIALVQNPNTIHTFLL